MSRHPVFLPYVAALAMTVAPPMTDREMKLREVYPEPPEPEPEPEPPPPAPRVLTDADKARIAAAERKRERRQARRAHHPRGDR